MEKKSNKRRKLLTTVLAMLLSGLGAIIFFSPYGTNNSFPYPLIEQSIIIDRPVEKVFQYLGNSKNAEDWSVFVDHITTINPDEVPDGKEGSIRRCFVQADEKGMQWDELTTAVVPNEKRQLEIYGFKDFPMTADDLATEQLYEKIDAYRCKLTFTVFFKGRTPTLMERLKMYIGAYQIRSIFEDNMENIKRLVEQKTA